MGGGRGAKTADLSGDACHVDQEVRGGRDMCLFMEDRDTVGDAYGGPTPGPVVAKGTHAEPIRLSL